MGVRHISSGESFINGARGFEVLTNCPAVGFVTEVGWTGRRIGAGAEVDVRVIDPLDTRRDGRQRSPNGGVVLREERRSVKAKERVKIGNPGEELILETF